MSENPSHSGSVPDSNSDSSASAHADYADPMLLAGQSAGIWVYIGALLLAAAADFANFFQIVQDVLDQESWKLYLILLGLTACVLFLAHAFGVMYRGDKAGEPTLRRSLMWACLIVWMLLGVIGLALRLQFHEVTHASLPSVTGQSGTSAPATAAPAGGATATYPTAGAAMMFLALYLGTGLVAVIGGYLTHNPDAAAFKRVRRQHEKEAAAAAIAAHDFISATGELHVQRSLLETSQIVEKADAAEIWWIGEELKQRTRALIAQRAQDAALTDAYFPEDDDPDDDPGSGTAPPPNPS